MGKFRFQVYDPAKGALRSGRVEAADAEEARALLEKHKLEVRSLERESSLEYSAESKTPLIDFGPAPEVAYRPSLGQRLTEAWSQTGLLKSVGAGLGLLGLLLTVVFWSGPTASPEGFNDIQVRVEGELSGVTEGAILLLRLPQVPLQVKSPAPAQPGRYQVSTEFTAEVVPDHCEVLVLREGRVVKESGRLNLSGQPLTATWDQRI